MRLMIVYSDNTATNMVLDQTRHPIHQFPNGETRAQGDADQRQGLQGGHAHRPGARQEVRPRLHNCPRDGSTPRAIDAGKVVSPDACKEMLGHLRACDDKEKMTRFLPPGTVVAHKTGSVQCLQDGRGDHLHEGRPGRPVRADQRERGPALGGRQRGSGSDRQDREGSVRPLRGEGQTLTYGGSR